ncbi:MAG: SRPBCC family protein [Proteobacteria bacterium]|nr:SRPBCC family protein [Pseudomonadota bacterium]
MPTTMPIALAAAASVLVVPVATAEVTSVGAAGFEIREQIHVSAAPDAVYGSLLSPKRWWDPQHTYSGNAQNLTLDAKAGGCWCETLPGGGSVEHLSVVYFAPGKVIRFRGALGPLQAMGVAGSMTVKLTATGGGTELTLTYVVGGYYKAGFDELAKAVDGVLASQVGRLKKWIETGSPT